MLRLFWYFLLFLFCNFSHASICHHVAGRWQGTWQDLKGQYQTRLQIDKHASRRYTGNFLMENGVKGKVHIQCTVLNKHEASLRLREDPPYFNPCRGLLIKDKAHVIMHVFCFEPNENGYFHRL